MGRLPKFHDLSIRGKQMMIIMLTCSAALLLACASFVAYEISRFRGEMVNTVSSLAEVVGRNTTAALDFNDPAAADQTLEALNGDPNILLAHVHTPQGEVFASYIRQGTLSPPEIPPLPGEQHIFTSSHLYLFRDIIQGGEKLGTIELVAGMSELTNHLMRYAGIAGLVLVVALTAAYPISHRLQKLVSDPIMHLAAVARSVAQDKNYSVRATRQSGDELGHLVDGFNEMLEQIQARDSELQRARDELELRVEDRTRELETTHRQLVEASRQSGMAEIASNILHNVGNVLNSVNISTGLIVDHTVNSKAASLARVVALLKEHEADLGEFITSHPNGRHVPQLLAQISQHILGSQEKVARELESLRRNIEHIKEIVAMQQSYTTAGGVKEVTDIVKLVEDSLDLNMDTLTRHGVKVVREYAEVPPMNVEKHKILQILVNLVRNAKLACQESGRPDKCLVVRIKKDPDNLFISVEDNGIGIPEKNLTKIFSHGFTTRQGGHGFGLHSGALAAREMGGSLIAQSDGPGKGALFTLQLPIT